ncbi:MAG: hypothetical protein K9L30_15275 [Desulfobacterales bacterium]|nr:hypothetical protein [Desulfobacterales bacterium]
MIEELDEVYTKTMAEFYVQQGYLNEALKIYQHLLEQSPDDHDLFEAAVKIETKLAKQPKTETLHEKNLAQLMCKWFDLMLAFNRLKKINMLKALR